MTHTHIFHVVLYPILLEVGGCLCSVEPLCGIHVCLLKVVPVDLQLVIWVGAQVHCSEKNVRCNHKEIWRGQQASESRQSAVGQAELPASAELCREM